MKLLIKETCSVCEGKLKLMGNQRIAGHVYICDDCKKKCSADISRMGWASMSPEDAMAHIQEHASDLELIRTTFRHTHSIRSKEKTIIAVDGDRGWWYIGNRKKPDIFYFNQVISYQAYCQPDLLENSTLARKVANSALDILDSSGVYDKSENRPMEIVVQLDHPYIQEIRIPLSDTYVETPAEVETCQNLAQEILHMFDHFCYVFRTEDE